MGSSASPIALPPGVQVEGAPQLPPGFQVEQHSIASDIGDTLKQYWDKINPVTAAQSLVSVGRAPIETLNAYSQQNNQLYEKAKDAFKNGDYSEGVRHALGFFLNGIPGVGASLDAAGNKAQSGDYKGAIADTAALATQIVGAKVGSKLLDAATEPGVVPTLGDVGASAKAAIKAGAPDVAKGTGKAVIGGAVDAALEASGIPGASYVAHGAGLGGGLIGVRQIGRGVAKGWNAGVDTMSARLAPIEAAGPSSELLEGVAQGMWGKPFDNLSEADQAIVRRTASRIGVRPEPPVASGSIDTRPVDTGTPVTKGKTIEDLLQEELAARRSPAQPAPQVAPATAMPSVAPATPAVAPQPAPTPVPGSTAPTAAWLDNETTGLGVPKIAANRAAKAQRFIKAIGGTRNLPTNQSEWARLADQIGEKVPSLDTQEQIAFGLNRRMVTGTETPGTIESTTPEALAKNPKALKIAQQLQQEMQRSGTAPSMPVGVKGNAIDIQSVFPGGTVTLKNGKTVVVKELHPDGTFEYE